MILAMRRVIPVVFVAAVMLACGCFTLVARHVADKAASAQWPLQLGSLRDVPARYPKRNASAAARRRCAVSRSHRADIATIRDHIVASGDAIDWQLDLSRLLDAPLPNLLAHLTVTRCLVASAIQRADWESLHAAWVLNRVIWRRPEVISQLIAVAGTRAICVAAARMRSPAPAWFGELSRYDYTRAMAAAQQADAYLFLTRTMTDPIDAETFAKKTFAACWSPFFLLRGADLTNRERRIAAHFVRAQRSSSRSAC